MISITKWWFNLKYSNDPIVKDYVEMLWNNETLYLSTDDIQYSINRKGSYIKFNVEDGILKGSFSYKGCFIIGENRYSIYLSNFQLDIQREIVNPIISNRKIVRDVFMENVLSVLHNNFSESVITSKSIFEEYVKRTIGKYSWCFNSYENVGTLVGSNSLFTIYENYGSYTIKSVDGVKVTKITDDNYVDFLKWYINEIEKRTHPSVPSWMLELKKTLDGID